MLHVLSALLSYVLLITVVITFITYLYFKFYIFNYWKSKGVEYVVPSFPFGNFGDVVFAQKSMGTKVFDIYNEFKSKGIKYGGYYAFNQPIFTTTSLELMKNITVKDFNHFDERGAHYDEEVDPLSGHLFSIRNPRWYKLRMKFSPTFTQAKLKVMFQTMLDCSTELKTVLDVPAVTSESVDIKDVMERFTTDIIGSCAFGLQCNSLKYPDAEIRRVGHEFFKPSLRNSIVITLANQAPAVLKYLKIPICESNTAKYFLDAIRYTIEEREKNKIERNDMIDLMIKLRNNEDGQNGVEEKEHRKIEDGITFNELAAHMFVFLLGGFETSATALTFALYELSMDQTIQDMLRKEILEVLNKYDGKTTYDGLTEMSYLDQVVNETLRKYPPLPILNRECSKDYPIPGTDILIEKGTKIVLSSLGVHRDPEYYPDPDRFNPERFKEDTKTNSDTFLPFGLGPRNCIGSRFGLLQIKIGLVELLRYFRFDLDPRMKLPLEYNKKSFTMQFKEPLYLRVTKI